ncbi:MAG: sulfatase-like hydrolase/transferase [Bacteroidales bacterium]|nr:sulfatase-like hydrolase/transferase [Bacteroidales bacterium]MBN2761795.1 sulfatase-like hydrolase/transferase [Bacteroidales bacterium]
MNVIKKNLVLLIVCYVIVIFLRSLETLLIIKNYGWLPHLIWYEIAGILVGFLIVNAIFLVTSPVYFLLQRIYKRLADMVFLFFMFIVSITHLAIIKYFVYQLIPLDIFLFQYSLKEILYTVRSSDTDYVALITVVVMIFAVMLLFYKQLGRVSLSKRLVFITGVFVILSFPVVVFGHSVLLSMNKFIGSKSYYFLHRSVSCFLNQGNEALTDKKTIRAFQRIFDDKEYISEDYPLLHKFENRDVLGPCFRKADSSPNLVILIVEGLNDDFIHHYKGVDLMPFLKDLKKESLYWDHFFTTGERSFAAVPSLLGALPYGERGFTLLNYIPYHYTLVNVLNRNDYHTSFFYGQGSWFHKKDRYFRFNNIDLLIDKDKFDEKYEKIVVGNDNFFWGYNDKDLFSQAFEVLDTITGQQQKRLDIYFTGTSHSPYVIAEQAHYDSLFDKTLGLLKSEADVQFFYLNKKYIQALRFTDDALQFFFKTYKERPEYGNTVFIITGDHPMSEIPVRNSLKRYHVPLLIFSPLLHTGKVFHGISDFSDLYETILSYLSSNYSVCVPPVSTALGAVLDTTSVPGNEKSIAFMNDNREIVDFYGHGYYISNASLFRTTNDLDLESIKDPGMLNKLTYNLSIFKEISEYASVGKKILPAEMYFNYLNYEIYTSRVDSADISFNSEFHDIVERTKVKNSDLFYDISFRYNLAAGKTTSLVYQLTNAHDSIVFWQCLGLPENGELQEHIRIPEQKLNDSVLYFKSFFWNQMNEKIEYSGLETFLYGD